MRLSPRWFGASDGYRILCRRAGHIETTLALAVFGGVAAGTVAGLAGTSAAAAFFAAAGTALAGLLARAPRTARGAYYLTGIVVSVAVIAQLAVPSPLAALAVAVLIGVALVGTMTPT